MSLHYVERGSGRPLLLVHAMGSDGRAWKGRRSPSWPRRARARSPTTAAATATAVRRSRTSRRPCRSRPRTPPRCSTALDAAPAMLVGAGFGALVVLELLVRRPELASAAVVADPPLLAFVPEATKALAAERTLLEQALRDGGPEARSRRGSAPDAEPAFVQRICASRLGFFADYAGQSSWSPARGELRAHRHAGRGRDRREHAARTSSPPPTRPPGCCRTSAAAPTATSSPRPARCSADPAPRSPDSAARQPTFRATTDTVPPRRARPNSASSTTATGASGSASSVTSASRLRSGALRFSAW